MNTLCHIIGVLDNGTASLNSQTISLLHSAKHVIAGTRVLELFANEMPNAKTYDLTSNLKNVPLWISNALNADESVVVLASGDPLCHGIGSFLAGKIEPEKLQILPNLSTIQLAFSELKLAWQNAKIVSIHNKDAGEWQRGATSEHGLYELAKQCRQQELLVVLTSPENNPPRIARLLEIENLADDFEMAIAQNLRQPSQKVTNFLPISTVAKNSYSEPNVVILKRKQPLKNPVLFGSRDESFVQRKPEKGLITKREVRAVSLARMQLTRSSIVWDIGAGCGSVGLEAARLCPDGHVFAIEKNVDDIANVEQNHAAWQISNYSFFHGKAPQFLDSWQNPDAVFIGGSGGELAQLITLCLNRLNLGGWLVMNFVTLENLATAVETLKQAGATWDVTQIQASRSSPILNMNRLQAENPVWIVSATKTL
jgi:precorrin-6B C5,15-methyltransferase / cobalt-precorrin-6B C5,C15-methyltransferase